MDNDLLAKAKEIQRQKLLEQAKTIQSQKVGESPYAGYLNPALKALHYPLGILETGAAALGSLGKNAAQGVAGVDPNVVSTEDIKNALNPIGSQPPSASDYANRLGIPTGGSLSEAIPGAYSEKGSGGLLNFRAPEKGGPLDITPRGTAITAAEVLGDPMNAVIAKPIAAALKGTGKAVNKWGLKAADIAAEDVGKGKNAVSDLLFENKIAGTPTQIANKSDTLSSKILAERDALLEKAKSLGARPNMGNALAEAESELQKMKMSGDPSVKDIIPILEAKIAEYKNISPIDLKAQSDWKTSLYNSLPNSTWGEATRTTPGREFQKTMARGLKQDIERQANMATPVVHNSNELVGEQIAQKNADLGTLLSAQKAMGSEAAKSIKKNMLTSVDPMVFALGHGSGIGAPALAAKKAADVLKSTWLRTHAGQLLNNTGDKLPLDNFIRQQSVWQNLLNQENKK